MVMFPFAMGVFKQQGAPPRRITQAAFPCIKVRVPTVTLNRLLRHDFAILEEDRPELEMENVGYATF